ncbi:TPA: hypothetical protein ACS55J_000707 [Salmonella enterica]
MINEPAIKPRHTPTQRTQRDEFLKTARLAQLWINGIIWNADRDNWPEVENYFEGGGFDHKRLKSLLPTDRAKPRGE